MSYGLNVEMHKQVFKFFYFNHILIYIFCTTKATDEYKYPSSIIWIPFYSMPHAKWITRTFNACTHTHTKRQKSSSTYSYNLSHSRESMQINIESTINLIPIRCAHI